MKYALTKEHPAVVGRKVGCEKCWPTGRASKPFYRRGQFMEGYRWRKCPACHGLGYTWEINWGALVVVRDGKPYTIGGIGGGVMRLDGVNERHPAWPAWKDIHRLNPPPMKPYPSDGPYVHMPERECPNGGVDDADHTDCCRYTGTIGRLDRLPELNPLLDMDEDRLAKWAMASSKHIAAILDLDKQTLEVRDGE